MGNNPNGFKPFGKLQEPQKVYLGANLKEGDPFYVDGAGAAQLVTATTTRVKGVMIQDGTSGEFALGITDKSQLYSVQTTTASAQTLVGESHDMSGATGATKLNEGATTYKPFRVEALDPNTDVGAYGRVIVSINKWQSEDGVAYIDEANTWTGKQTMAAVDMSGDLNIGTGKFVVTATTGNAHSEVGMTVGPVLAPTFAAGLTEVRIGTAAAKKATIQIADGAIHSEGALTLGPKLDPRLTIDPASGDFYFGPLASYAMAHTNAAGWKFTKDFAVGTVPATPKFSVNATTGLVSGKAGAGSDELSLQAKTRLGAASHYMGEGSAAAMGLLADVVAELLALGILSA